MPLDPLEKDRLRRKMALKMQVMLGSGKSVTCVSGHYYEEPTPCDLCQERHANEVLVVRNRANNTFKLASACLREMVRFKVTDVEEMPKWLEKIKELKAEHEKRKSEIEKQRQDERERLGKKFIVRKRGPQSDANT